MMRCPSCAHVTVQRVCRGGWMGPAQALSGSRPEREGAGWVPGWVPGWWAVARRAAVQLGPRLGSAPAELKDGQPLRTTPGFWNPTFAAALDVLVSVAGLTTQGEELLLIPRGLGFTSMKFGMIILAD